MDLGDEVEGCAGVHENQGDKLLAAADHGCPQFKQEQSTLQVR